MQLISKNRLGCRGQRMINQRALVPLDERLLGGGIGSVKVQLSFGLNHLFYHQLDFYSFFKMIKFVGHDPPLGSFHEGFWIVILVGEEGIK